VSKKPNIGLPVCIVRAQGFMSVGALLLDTSTHVVLLNNVRKGVDLGPIKRIRKKHIEPEADIHVIPKGMVVSIERLDFLP
jgi:hypothetical protein